MSSGLGRVAHDREPRLAGTAIDPGEPDLDRAIRTATGPQMHGAHLGVGLGIERGRRRRCGGGVLDRADEDLGHGLADQLVGCAAEPGQGRAIEIDDPSVDGPIEDDDRGIEGVDDADRSRRGGVTDRRHVGAACGRSPRSTSPEVTELRSLVDPSGTVQLSSTSRGAAPGRRTWTIQPSRWTAPRPSLRPRWAAGPSAITGSCQSPSAPDHGFVAARADAAPSGRRSW